ncbi:hypothetical protein BH10PLA2_BH10PLA2_22890 [soil metagenome]
MEYDIRLEQHAAKPLAVVRHCVAQKELGAVIRESCGTVWNVVRSQKIAGAGRHVAVYLDGQVNLEVGVELETPFAGFGEVVGSATPVGPVATTTHFGSYGMLLNAHKAIQNWCRSNQHELAGPNWEVYGHWEDEWNNNPAKIRTDIYYLLVPDGSSSK